MKTITSTEGEPIDLTLWRAGRRNPGELEAALDNNRGLAARTVLLPARVAIDLPDAPVTRTKKTVRLWD